MYINNTSGGITSEKVLLTWSGGKDSVLTLHKLTKSGDHQVVSLITTITKDYSRISMHGVRQVLLEQQAASLGYPLKQVYISKSASGKEYEAKMQQMLIGYFRQGIRSVAFGDIFLDDIKKYREENLSRIGMRALFPLWQRDTKRLAYAFIDLGFKAVITCIDSGALNKRFAGRIYNQQFLSELPPNVDPCGENGEFHTFVYDGPIFKKRILYQLGEVVLRDERFYFCDLVPLRKS